MGLLSALFGGGNRKPVRSTAPLVVRVKFRELTQEPGDPEGGWYAYEWRLPQPPVVGARIFVPGMDGDAPAIVVAMGTPRDYPGPLSRVSRLATRSDLTAAVAAAKAKEEAAQRRLDAWLDMARKRAGLPGGSDRLRTPEGLPELQVPNRLAMSPGEANELGRAWWRAYKNARGADEELAFKAIAHRWYSQRDDYETWRNPASIVRGVPYVGWVETIKQMKRDGLHDDALRLLTECQDATLRADGHHPAPWYFEQAAIIYRKEKRLDDEEAVLQRYFRALGERGGHPKMVERWDKLQALLAKRGTQAAGSGSDQGR